MRYILTCLLFFTAPAFAQQKSALVYFEFAGGDFTGSSEKDFVKGYADKVGADTSNTSLGMMPAKKLPCYYVNRCRIQK